MDGIGIIANPHSKLNKRYPERSKLLSYILGENGQLASTNTLEDLARVAREFYERKIQILAINGGDGTISRTLTAFTKAYGSDPLPKIALLRGGTMNVVATNLGVVGRPEDVLYRLVQAYALYPNTPLNVVRLKTLSIEGQIGFLFGNGVVASFLKLFYENKTGAVGAIGLILRLYAMFFLDRHHFNKVIRSSTQVLMPTPISRKGAPIEHLSAPQSMLQPELRMVRESAAVFASTIERMPMGPRLFPFARELPRSFQCVSFDMRGNDLIW